MAYTRSAAFKRLLGKLDDLRATVKGSHRIRLGGRRNSQVRQAMQCGVVLLAFGHFEAFIRELVEDTFSALAAAGVSAGKLDSMTRTQSALICRMNEWGQFQDPSKLSERIWNYREMGGFHVLDDNSTVSSDLAAKILDGVSYPKIDNIKKILIRLGFAAPISHLRSVAKYPVDQFLISFHDARVDLAHNGIPPGWAQADFLLKLNELTRFANCFDRVIHAWFRKFSVPQHWPA